MNLSSTVWCVLLGSSEFSVLSIEEETWLTCEGPPPHPHRVLLCAEQLERCCQETITSVCGRLTLYVLMVVMFYWSHPLSAVS